MKHQDAGDAIESSPNSLPARGNSTATDAKPQTNNLLDALNSFIPQKQNNGMLCSVRRMLETITETERAKLQELLENESILSSDLSLLVKRNGYHISGDVMRRHRRRKVTGTGCACP